MLDCPGDENQPLNRQVELSTPITWRRRPTVKQAGNRRRHLIIENGRATTFWKYYNLAFWGVENFLGVKNG